MARPKSEATRIKDLESDLAALTRAYEASIVRAREQNEILFSMYIILCDIRDSEAESNDAIGAYIHALTLMAEKGTDI